MLDAIHKLTRNRTVIIAVDDLHLLDAASAEVLRMLIDVIHDKPIIGIFTAELDQSADLTSMMSSFRTARNVNVSELPALERDETRNFLCNRLKVQHLEPDLEEYLCTLAEGNPSLLQVLLSELINQQAIVISDKIAKLILPIEMLSLGSSIRDLFTHRIYRLDSITRSCARTAALVGPVFPVRLLVKILERSYPIDSILQSIRTMEQTRLVRSFPVHLPSRQFSPRLIWDVLQEEGHLDSDAAVIHKIIAQETQNHPAYAEFVDVSHHLEFAGELEFAAQFALTMAQEAIRRNSLAHAYTLLTRSERCAQAVGLDTVRTKVATLQVQVLVGQGAYSAAIITAEQAQALPNLTDVQRAEILFALSKPYAFLGKWDRAIALAQEAYTLAEHTNEGRLQILGRNDLNTAGGLGPWDPSVFRASAAQAEQLGEAVLAAQSLGLEAQGDLFDGRPVHGLKILTHCLDIQVLYEHLPDRHLILNNLAIAYALLERYAEAHTTFKLLIESVAQTRDHWSHAAAWSNYAAALIRIGDYDAAYDAASKAYQGFDQIGTEGGEALQNQFVAQVMLELSAGKPISSASRSLLTRIKKIWTPSWRIWERGSLRLDMARLYLRIGRSTFAYQQLAELLAEPGRYRYRLVEASQIWQLIPENERQTFTWLDNKAVEQIWQAYPELQSNIFAREPLALGGHFIIRGWAL
ncbi:MAG: hypothetical protein EOM24_03220 [Chloroflexia bacterium]|nr:hypothetical protein [Chloroflexia bacterium]